MDFVDALIKFVKRADRIDISPLSHSHVISVADNRIDMMFTGTKVSGKTRYNEREDGIVELGSDRSDKTSIENGEVYVEFKNVEIFNSDNNELVGELVDLIQNRYEELKKEYQQKFIALTEFETSPVDVESLGAE